MKLAIGQQTESGQLWWPDVAGSRSSPATGRSLLLAPLTTLKLGGRAEQVFVFDDTALLPDLVRAIRDGSEPSAPAVVIGAGSNVLVADTGVRTPIVLVRTTGVEFNRPDPSGPVLVTARAGHPWADLVRELADRGLAGTEMMTGIPGTVGAMPVQNVGAYGQETADHLVSVEAWDWQLGRTVRLGAVECGLEHRSSRFKRNHRWLILSVTFALHHDTMSAPVTYREVARKLDVPVGTRVPVAEAMAAVDKVRADKGMLLDDAASDGRSVGSVFLSPRISADRAARLRQAQAPVHDFADGSTRVSASWLMRDAGLRLGEPLAPGVRISTRQYTLVADDSNGPMATTAGFIEAARQVQDKVAEATGVWLSPEPDAIGDLPAYRTLQERAGDGTRSQ